MLFRSIKERGLVSKMILQVHDELVFDVMENELDSIQPIIHAGMKEALLLPNQVPLVTAIGVGKNWLEAH